MGAGGLFEVIKMGVDVQAANAESSGVVAEARQNQVLAERAASDAVERGRYEAGLSRMKTSSVIAKQRVAYANSGVDATVGTPADVAADTRVIGEMDAKTIQNNAAREAWGFRTQGERFGQEMEKESERNKYKIAGTILGGLGRMAGGANFGGG